MAQRRRVGLITQRSEDRNLPELDGDVVLVVALWNVASAAGVRFPTSPFCFFAFVLLDG